MVPVKISFSVAEGGAVPLFVRESYGILCCDIRHANECDAVVAICIVSSEKNVSWPKLRDQACQRQHQQQAEHGDSD